VPGMAAGSAGTGPQRLAFSMTQVPPSRLPGASCEPPQPDPALDAWVAAYAEHRRRVRAESRRYAAQCRELHERYGPPAGSMSWGEIDARLAWAQAALIELDEMEA